MANSPYVRTALAHAALEMAPPLVRRTLIKDAAFRDEYGLSGDAVISFGDSGVSVQRSDLLSAFRILLAGRKQFDVQDTEGRKWRVRKLGESGELPRFTMARAKQRLVLPDFCALSADREVRLRSLAESVADVNLPESAHARWREILGDRALEDDELDEYHSDFRDTPVHMARTIQGEIQTGTSSISSLVPPSRRYFERLVGAYDESASIRDCASGVCESHFRQLMSWQPYEGFLFSLFLSSHASLTAEIPVELLSDDELARAFDFLDKHGDRLSQLGGIEVGFRVLPSRPSILPILERLVGQVRDDDVDGQQSHFKLLSALFVLVDGELSRRRIFASEPPFYRRLAAFAQAALIHRQLVNTNVDFDGFAQWALDHRAAQFYLQSLTDMRLEPRWRPDLVAGAQVKADYFGRIMIAANTYKENIADTALAPVVLETGPGSLRALTDFFHPYLPGPLEGAEETSNVLPPEMVEKIEAQLATEDVSPASFIALVNSALIFRVGHDQAELAAKALKVGNYRLGSVKDKSELIAVLNGLASVAAAARSHSLADELRILVRRYLQDAQYTVSIEEAVRVCLMAGASRIDLNDWRDFVGQWLTELAFGDLKDNDGGVLYARIHNLCHAVPELWVSCGRADAALMAFNAK